MTVCVICGALLYITIAAICHHFVENGTRTVLPAQCCSVFVTHQEGTDIGRSTGG